MNLSKINSPMKIDCIDCGRREPGVMVHDELWLKICKQPEEVLCLDCMTIRLGRTITLNDLKECGLTHIIRYFAE